MAYDDIAISEDDGKLRVRAPYNPAFARRARALGGDWEKSAGTWTFNARNKARVLNALDEFFWWDENQSAEATVTLHIDPHDGMYEYDRGDSSRSWFAGRILAVRAAVNAPVRLAGNTTLTEGDWPRDKYHTSSLNVTKGELTVEVWDVPVSFLARMKEGSYRVVADEGTLPAVKRQIDLFKQRVAALEQVALELEDGGE